MNPTDLELGKQVESGDILTPIVPRIWLRVVSWLQPRQLSTRLGIPGFVATGLLTVCGAFYVSVMMPMDARINEVQDTVRTLAERVEQASSGSRKGVLPVAEQLTEFYRLFPKQGQLTDTVGKVFDAARVQGITLHRGEYRVAEEDVGRLRRFQMLLPVKGDYPAIRRFLARLAVDVPTLALEHIQFERKKIGDSQIEATIKLALYLERGS
jgi:hypothetical protein